MQITLATLKYATAQQVFDQVKTHLLAQNKRASADTGGGCKYRMESGLKCAAGCLIADDEYNTELEGKAWNILALKGCVPDSHQALIAALQRVHDNKDPGQWGPALKVIADALDLTFEV